MRTAHTSFQVMSENTRTIQISWPHVAFNTGMDLVASNLPNVAFATRLLAEMGLGG